MNLPDYVTIEEVQRVCRELGFRDWTQMADSAVLPAEAESATCPACGLGLLRMQSLRPLGVLTTRAWLSTIKFRGTSVVMGESKCQPRETRTRYLAISFGSTHDKKKCCWNLPDRIEFRWLCQPDRCSLRIALRSQERRNRPHLLIAGGRKARRYP